MPHEPLSLNYAARRGLWIEPLPIRLLAVAACVGVFACIMAVGFLSDYMTVHDRKPRWWRIVTPLATITAGVCGILAILPSRPRRKPLVLISGVAILVTSTLCASTMVFGAREFVGREIPYRTRCAANLRQIGQAIQIYTSEHAGVLPADFDDLRKNTDITTAAFQCPLGQALYVYHGGGLTISQLSAGDILADEPASNHDGDGCNVLLGDGHVEFLIPRELAQRRAIAATRPAPGPAQ